MRKPRSTSIPELLRRSRHFWASLSDGFASSPRQICPPKAGLSSTSSTLAPLSAALVAAARPAGPPPTTTMSQLCLFIGIDLHTRPARHLATLDMTHAVNGDPALKANSHAAHRPAWLPRYGSAKTRSARHQDCCRHGCPGRNGD